MNVGVRRAVTLRWASLSPAAADHQAGRITVQSWHWRATGDRHCCPRRPDLLEVSADVVLDADAGELQLRGDEGALDFSVIRY